MHASTSPRIPRDSSDGIWGAFLRYLPHLLIDSLLITACFALALLMRFDFDVPTAYVSRFWLALPVVLAIFTLALVAWGIHEHLWQFAGLHEISRLWAACITAGGVCLLANIALIREDGSYALPLSVIFTGSTFSAIALSGSRIWRRVRAALEVSAAPGLGAERVLIVGCGSAGELLARELSRHRRTAYFPVGYVDDDPGKVGKIVHGIRVLGGLNDIPTLVETQDVDIVAVAIPSQPGIIRDIVRLCRKTPAKVLNVPGMTEILEGHAQVDALRAVTIEDLLRRDEVTLDHAGMEHHFAGKTILVTGAAGSIGSELCRQLLPFHVARLVLLDSNESGLFDLEHELRGLIEPQTELMTVIADVTFPDQIETVFVDHAPQVVFHAAAYKHVPLMESHPHQALRVNLLGTENLCRAAADRAEQFVLVSSDKSVRPQNVMGCTKWLAEQLVADWNARSTTRFCAVRFGNVLGSRGSVVPLFKTQIEAGGPVTVTDPEATRYFMTIRESAQLVIQTAALGEGGSLFVLDMGDPVRIIDLAQDLITLSGRRVGTDIEIVFTGLRPGEKVHEELFNPGEGYERTSNPKIIAVCLAATNPPALQSFLAELRANLPTTAPEQLKRRLGELIPDYLNGSAA